MLHHNEYKIVLKILNNIGIDPKFKTVNSSVLAPHVVEYMQSIGFELLGSKLCWSEQQELEETRKEVQKLVDETRDPDTISFRQVAEILQRGGTLPGIEKFVDTSPIGNWNEITEMQPPRKPWDQ